jgi:cellulose synthase/poly-beta-1,6-N-acetylglucosamine synthase-like glycosyltransferase
MSTLILTTYLLTALALAMYGLLGLYTLGQYWRHRHDAFPLPTPPDKLPPVTIQLPIYNEPFVVGRLIKAAVALDYPRDRLQIQVIDDSTDQTTRIAAQLVHAYQKKGFHIALIHRRHRHGFKAGALAHATRQATGDYLALFDADFQPAPDFLQRTVPYFCQQPDLGMIQVRWGHLNDQTSPLTAAQAIALDKHFAMEQTVRHRADLFPKFNGTGGIWRKECVEDAGGWQTDTVCEDLCLSTRAVLQGWRFLFLNDVIAPAEIPASISAYKIQQKRWAKGSLQCLRKYGRSILTASHHTIAARLYALLTMSAYVTHLLVIVLLLLQLPLILLNYSLSSWMLLLTLAGLGQPLLFIRGQQVLHTNWLWRLRHFPTLLLVAVGLAPTNTLAIIEALFGRTHTFDRTPKQGDTAVHPAFGVSTRWNWMLVAELFLALYAGVTLVTAVARQNYGPILFLLTCLGGFSYVGWLTIRESYTARIYLRRKQQLV